MKRIRDSIIASGLWTDGLLDRESTPPPLHHSTTPRPATNNVVQSKPAFTLIELLVVVAVIGILSALLLTALMAAKERVKQAECAHNVRQLGLAVQLFVSDHHVYPLAANPDCFKGKFQEHDSGWQGALRRVINCPVTNVVFSQGIWECPAASRPKIFPPNQGWIAYGYNGDGLGTIAGAKSRSFCLGLGGHSPWGLAASGEPVNESEVVSPSRLYMLGDAFTGNDGVIVDGTWGLHRWSGLRDYLGSTKRSMARHNGKANMAFADGHVEAVSLKHLFQNTTDAALSQWNRDNLPHREALSH